MANNDYLEELLEESIEAQNRSTRVLSALGYFMLIQLAYGLIAALVTFFGLWSIPEYYLDGLTSEGILSDWDDAKAWVSGYITVSVVLVLAGALHAFFYTLAVLRSLKEPQGIDSYRPEPTGEYKVPAATVNRNSVKSTVRQAPVFAPHGRNATEKDLAIAKYFSTDEYAAWQLFGRPNLEDWVDDGRPNLLKWLEEHAEI